MPLIKKSLLMGEDTFLQIHNWKQYEDIIDNTHTIFICPRGEKNSDLLNTQSKNLFKIKADLKITVLSHHKWESISSSTLKK